MSECSAQGQCCLILAGRPEKALDIFVELSTLSPWYNSISRPNVDIEPKTNSKLLEVWLILGRSLKRRSFGLESLKQM